MNGAIALVHDLLDVQLLDADGRRVGRIDDIELDDGRVTALLVGVGLYPRRVPRRLRRVAQRIVGPETWGRNTMRIPWSDVDRIETTIRLRRPAAELGLGAGDDPDNWIVSRLPWN
jgi:sporulation protein YlmC with PRC-barrel domain